jgi:hypothetical protein
MAGLTWWAYAAAFVVALMALNRVRGGGLYGDRLPGHPRFYVAPAVALLYWPLAGGPNAVAAGVGFLVWSWLPWGRWYDLGRIPEGYMGAIRPPSAFERWVNGIAPNDYLAFTLRNVLGLLLAAILLHPAVLLLAGVQLAAYEAGWRLWPATPISLGEGLTGMGWGVALVWVAVTYA